MFAKNLIFTFCTYKQKPNELNPMLVRKKLINIFIIAPKSLPTYCSKRTKKQWSSKTFYNLFYGSLIKKNPFYANQKRNHIPCIPLIYIKKKNAYVGEQKSNNSMVRLAICCYIHFSFMSLLVFIQVIQNGNKLCRIVDILFIPKDKKEI